MQVKQINSIADIDLSVWRQLADDNDPFVSYEFLLALEQSGCVGESTGWQVQHLLVYAGHELVGFMPMYQKLHSWGEYVFDQSWADAYRHYGRNYYPKWVTAIPFTPCQGKRLITKDCVDALQIMHELIDYIRQHAQSFGISSWHCLFPVTQQLDCLRNAGLLVREDVQFHWRNRGYRDFQDYLQLFNSKNRKKINRERLRIKQQGIEMIRLSGTEVTAQQWQVFYQFYTMTYLIRGQQPYLTQVFFEQLAATMPERMVLILALKNSDYVGAALSFVGSDSYYGRYWGGLEQFHSLHFEACYYQGLEYCIEHGLQHFDSGAQGEHKISRGFEPVSCYSVHWINDEKFSAAIKHFLQREQQSVQRYKQQATECLPFKKV